MTAQNLLLFFRALACSPRAVVAIPASGATLSRLITSEITAASGPVLELGPRYRRLYRSAAGARCARERPHADRIRLGLHATAAGAISQGARALDGCGLDGFPRSVRAPAGGRGQRAAATQFCTEESRRDS